MPATINASPDIQRVCERSRAGTVRGFFPSLRTGRAIAWASHSELALLHRLEFDARVSGMVRNELHLSLPAVERAPTFRPAFRLSNRDGKTWLVDVVPDEMTGNRWFEILHEQLRQAAMGAGVQYLTLKCSSLGSPGLRHTFAELAGLRVHRPDQSLVAQVDEILRCRTTPLALAELMAGQGIARCLTGVACSLAAKGRLRLWPSEAGPSECRVAHFSWTGAGQ